jgi:valyl-tRNA synthetase
MGETRIPIYPPSFKEDLEKWLNNIQDWCLSRQLWWGHPIPAYSYNGQWVIANSEEEAIHAATALFGEGVTGLKDKDVLDTWFSSSLLPLTSHGWTSSDGLSNLPVRKHICFIYICIYIK